MKISARLIIVAGLTSLALPACNLHHEEKTELEQHKIVLTSPKVQDVVVTQRYISQIRSQCHIDVCALASGYLLEIPVKEGQLVKKGDLMFKILPTLYQAKWEAELAEVQLAQIEYDNTMRLYKDKTPVVSQTEVNLFKAKLEKAQAKANQAQAELGFTEVRARYEGIIDRLLKQQGSTIKEGEVLTTLSDNSTMWVYFNVPEVRYLDYVENLKDNKNNESAQIELVLANGKKYSHVGKIGAIEAKFNNETGNIPFRADFPNPDRLLRHGQTGTVLIHQTLKNALVIPQRATYEILDRRYVYVVDKDKVVHQREIKILDEQDDIFVISSGLKADDKIVFEGVQQVRDGEKIESEFQKPDEVLANLKHKAE